MINNNAVIMDPKLFIIITDFNGFEQTKNCLNAIRGSYFRISPWLWLIMGQPMKLNDASSMGIPVWFALSVPLNFGWTGLPTSASAMALGCGAELVMLLNND